MPVDEERSRWLSSTLSEDQERGAHLNSKIIYYIIGGLIETELLGETSQVCPIILNIQLRPPNHALSSWLLSLEHVRRAVYASFTRLPGMPRSVPRPV